MPENILITTMGGIEKMEIATHLLDNNDIGNIVCVDAEESAQTRYLDSLSDRIKVAVVPLSSDETYTQALNAIALENSVTIVLPIDTREAIKITNEAEDYNQLNLCHIIAPTMLQNYHDDKGAYMDVLKSKGYSFVDYLSLSKGESIPRRNHKIKEYLTALISTNYTHGIMKPRSSNGSRGIKVIDFNYDPNEHFNSKDPYSISLETFFSEIVPILDQDFVIQPFFSGQNYNVDCYKASDGTLYTVVHKIVGDPWGQVKSSIVLSSDDPVHIKCVSMAEKLVTDLELDRMFNFEVREKSTEDDFLMLVEVNARTSAVTIQSKETELDLITIALDDYFNNPLPPTTISEKELFVSFKTYKNETT